MGRDQPNPDPGILKPPSDFGITAGISNITATGHLPPGMQYEYGSALHILKGALNPSTIPAAGLTTTTLVDRYTDDDLAILTLTKPLDLSGTNVRAIRLPSDGAPEPNSHTPVALAGFGEETYNGSPNGTLNELIDPRIVSSCTTARVLCVASATSAVCGGDSGSGLYIPGRIPILIGVTSVATAACRDATQLQTIARRTGVAPIYSRFTYIGAPTVLKFIHTVLRTTQ